MASFVLAYLVTMITHFWGDPNQIQWESERRDLSKESDRALVDSLTLVLFQLAGLVLIGINTRPPGLKTIKSPLSVMFGSEF